MHLSGTSVPSLSSLYLCHMPRRLRKDLHDSGTDPNLFDKLKDTRSLEFDVDLLSNKCKVRTGHRCLKWTYLVCTDVKAR